MRMRLYSLAAVGVLSVSLFGQKPAWQPAPGHLTLELWPHRAPGAQSIAGAEIDTTTAKDRLVAGKPVIRLGNVSTPDAYGLLAKGKEHRRRDRRLPGRRISHFSHRSRGHRGLRLAELGRHHVRSGQIPSARLGALSQIIGRVAGCSAGTRNGPSRTPQSGTLIRRESECSDSPPELTFPRRSARTSSSGCTNPSTTPTKSAAVPISP